VHYHAILFMCNDVDRAEWVATNFKKHNPDIRLTVYNGGLDDVDTRSRVNADHYETGENLWHRNTRGATGSFGYGWFEKFYALAEEQDADYTIYLETDVQCNRPISADPKWDLSGVLNSATVECELIAYDFWGSNMNFGPFEEHVNPTPNKVHTGAGGTAFARSFLQATRPNLPNVKLAYEKIPYVFYADLMVTLLGRFSGCCFGDWSEVSDVKGSYRYDEVTDELVWEPSCTATTMIHGVKI